MVTKLTHFLLLLTISSTAYADEAKLMANQIIDSTFKVELSTQGMLISITKSLGGTPLKEDVTQCITDNTAPKLRGLFSDVLLTSLSPEAIILGAQLAAKPSIKKSKTFILTSDYSEEAATKNIQASAYQFMMAAKHTDNTSDKQELLDLAEWLNLNDPLFFNAFVDRIEDYASIIRTSIHSCTRN